MASAENLLHEAQFAFQSISFGESLSNTRNAARARSLCRKIIRKYPASMEASEAHAILRRLGDEAYTSKMAVQHRHVPASVHHRSPTPRQAALRTPVREEQRTFIVHDETETLDWSGLVGWLFTIPKVVLGMIVFAGFLLFGSVRPVPVPAVACVCAVHGTVPSDAKTGATRQFERARRADKRLYR